MFNKLDPGCLVLLEDVDCAGLDRTDAKSQPGMENQLNEFESEDDIASDSSEDSRVDASPPNNRHAAHTRGGDYKKHAHQTTNQVLVPREGREQRSEEEERKRQKEKNKKKAEEKRKRKSKLPPPSEVTLSGLLNVLDGIFAPGGILLIMTTNHVEKLDEALIRPGRADRKIHFTHATRKQAEMLFCNMYQYSPSMKQPPFDEKRVPKLAKEFAEQVPERIISCAHLQNYVVQHMLEPQAAVDGLTAWVQEYLQEKQQLRLGEAYVPEADTAPVSQEEELQAPRAERSLIQLEDEDLLILSGNMEQGAEYVDLLGLDGACFLNDGPQRTPSTVYNATDRREHLDEPTTAQASSSSDLPSPLIPTPSHSTSSPKPSPLVHMPLSSSLASTTASSSSRRFKGTVKNFFRRARLEVCPSKF